MQKRRYLVSIVMLSYVRNINNKNFQQFHWLSKCEVTDTALLVIVNHLNIISDDLKKKSDLKQIGFSTWMMQPMLVDWYEISNMEIKKNLQNYKMISQLKLYLI